MEFGIVKCSSSAITGFFNLKTPGREDDDTETKLYTKADYRARKEGGADTEGGAAAAGCALCH